MTTPSPSGNAGATVAEVSASPPARDTATGSSTYRLTFGRIVKSEWIRFVTIRSFVWTLAAAAVVMVAIGLVASAASTGAVEGPGGGNAPGFGGAGPLQTTLAGQTLVVLVIGVLGVLVGAREYGSGLVRVTMAAVPRRLPVIAARVLVFVAVVLPTLLVATLVAFFAGTQILQGAGVDIAAWSDAGVPRAVIGTALYLTGVGVLGVFLGTLTRGIGLGVGALIALVLVIPGFASLLLPDSWSGATDYLPSQAASAFTTVEASVSLSPGAGALVFVAWIVVLGAAAAWTLRHRDV